MRYKTASMPIREVLERPRIELKSGRILEPEVGEQVAIYTRCVHYNPDIFDNPHGFQWDRFVGKQGANAFSYQGKPLRYPLLAFGGGASICPGRHFAKNEFKLAAAMLFANLDMNLLSDTLPEEDQSRRGFGAAMPVADIEFSFRRKKHLSDAYSHSSPDVVTSIG